MEGEIRSLSFAFSTRSVCRLRYQHRDTCHRGSMMKTREENDSRRDKKVVYEMTKRIWSHQFRDSTWAIKVRVYTWMPSEHISAFAALVTSALELLTRRKLNELINIKIVEAKNESIMWPTVYKYSPSSFAPGCGRRHNLKLFTSTNESSNIRLFHGTFTVTEPIDPLVTSKSSPRFCKLSVTTWNREEQT